jgi:hypothetical protein
MMTPKRLGRELQARLDGPHDDEHTAAAADLAAECVRFLNYATGSHSPAGLVYPSTVYMVAADLSSATHRMVQLFGQLGDWLAAEDAAGMLGTDDGGPSADVVTAARKRLAAASASATLLSAQLSALQNGIAGLNGRGPNREGRAA